MLLDKWCSNWTCFVLFNTSVKPVSQVSLTDTKVDIGGYFIFEQLTHFTVHKIMLLLCLKTRKWSKCYSFKGSQDFLAGRLICEQNERRASRYKLLRPDCNYVDWWGKHPTNICSPLGFQRRQCMLQNCHLKFLSCGQVQRNQRGFGDSKLDWPWWNDPNPYSCCSVIRAFSFSTASLQTTLVTAMRDEPSSHSAAVTGDSITL